MELSLERVLQALHDCGICCGAVIAPPEGGLLVWIDAADRTERATSYKRLEGEVSFLPAPDAGARWLHKPT